MPSHTIRIAMLIAEVPVPSVLSTRGTFGAIFHDLLRIAASQIFPNINIKSTEYDVTRGEYPPDLAFTDVLLVTGSASSAYDDIEWIHRLDRYIHDVYINHPQIKIFGACFRHQIICQSLLRGYGVFVELDPQGFENGVREVVFINEFRQAIGESAKEIAVYQPTPEKMRLQFVHGDHVRTPFSDKLPSSWINFGSTEHCAVQGVYEPGRVFTLQGHFEFDRFINSETLKFIAEGLEWNPETLKGYLALMDAGDDSNWPLSWLWNF